MMIMAKQTNAIGSDTKLPYQRSSAPSKDAVRKAMQRQKARAKEMVEAGKGCRPLTAGFVKVLPPPNAPAEVPSNVEDNGRGDLAKKDLKLMLKSKRTQMTKQNYNRHLAVLHFMNYREQILESGKQEPRLVTALNVSRCFGRGEWYAKKVITWEKKWIEERCIPEGMQGRFAKSKSWFNDEGVKLAAREYLSGAGESKLTPCFKQLLTPLDQTSPPMGLQWLLVNICS